MTYVRLAMLAGLLAALIGAYFIGDRAGANRVIARDAKAMKAAVAELAAQQKRIDVLSSQVAAAQTEQTTGTREIYRESVKIVDRPVYRNQCVDADGGSLLDRARDNANREPAGVSADPATAPADDAAQR